MVPFAKSWIAIGYLITGAVSFPESYVKEKNPSFVGSSSQFEDDDPVYAEEFYNPSRRYSEMNHPSHAQFPSYDYGKMATPAAPPNSGGIIPSEGPILDLFDRFTGSSEKAHRNVGHESNGVNDASRDTYYRIPNGYTNSPSLNNAHYNYPFNSGEENLPYPPQDIYDADSNYNGDFNAYENNLADVAPVDEDGLFGSWSRIPFSDRLRGFLGRVRGDEDVNEVGEDSNTRPVPPPFYPFRYHPDAQFQHPNYPMRYPQPPPLPPFNSEEYYKERPYHYEPKPQPGHIPSAPVSDPDYHMAGPPRPAYRPSPYGQLQYRSSEPAMLDDRKSLSQDYMIAKKKQQSEQSDYAQEFFPFNADESSDGEFYVVANPDADYLDDIFAYDPVSAATQNEQDEYNLDTSLWLEALLNDDESYGGFEDEELFSVNGMSYGDHYDSESQDDELADNREVTISGYILEEADPIDAADTVQSQSSNTFSELTDFSDGAKALLLKRSDINDLAHLCYGPSACKNQDGVDENVCFVCDERSRFQCKLTSENYDKKQGTGYFEGDYLCVYEEISAEANHSSIPFVDDPQSEERKSNQTQASSYTETSIKLPTSYSPLLPLSSATLIKAESNQSTISYASSHITAPDHRLVVSTSLGVEPSAAESYLAAQEKAVVTAAASNFTPTASAKKTNSLTTTHIRSKLITPNAPLPTYMVFELPIVMAASETVDIMTMKWLDLTLDQRKERNERNRLAGVAAKESEEARIVKENLARERRKQLEMESRTTLTTSSISSTILDAATNEAELATVTGGGFSQTTSGGLKEIPLSIIKVAIISLLLLL